MSQRFRRCCIDPRLLPPSLRQLARAAPQRIHLSRVPLRMSPLRGIDSGVNSVLLSEREPDHERRQEQKQVERASNNMRLNRRRILFFHKPAFRRGEGSF